MASKSERHKETLSGNPILAKRKTMISDFKPKMLIKNILPTLGNKPQLHLLPSGVLATMLGEIYSVMTNYVLLIPQHAIGQVLNLMRPIKSN